MESMATEPGPNPEALPPTLCTHQLTQPPVLHGASLILFHDAEAGGTGPGPGPLPGLHSSISQPVGLLEGEVPGPRQARHACKHNPAAVRAIPAPHLHRSHLRAGAELSTSTGTHMGREVSPAQEHHCRMGLPMLGEMLLGCAGKQSKTGPGSCFSFPRKPNRAVKTPQTGSKRE